MFNSPLKSHSFKIVSPWWVPIFKSINPCQLETPLFVLPHVHPTPFHKLKKNGEVTHTKDKHNTFYKQVPPLGYEDLISTSDMILGVNTMLARFLE